MISLRRALVERGCCFAFDLLVAADMDVMAVPEPDAGEGVRRSVTRPAAEVLDVRVTNTPTL